MWMWHLPTPFPFTSAPITNEMKTSPTHHGNFLCNSNRRGFSIQHMYCKGSFEAVNLGAGGPTEIYIKFGPIYALSPKRAKPINISMPNQQQDPHSLSNIFNTTSYYSYTLHFSCRFSFLHLALAFLSIKRCTTKRKRNSYRSYNPTYNTLTFKLQWPLFYCRFTLFTKLNKNSQRWSHT